MEFSTTTQIYMSLWTVIAVILAIITFAIKITTLKNNMEYRLKNSEDKNTEQEKELARFNDKVNQFDVAFAEIKIRLTNIETLLLELKQQIKNK